MDRIDCDHMSGLLIAVAHDRCQDGFRDASSKQYGGFEPPLDPTECLASGIDRSHHLPVSSKLRPQRGRGSPYAELRYQIVQAHVGSFVRRRPWLVPDGSVGAPSASVVKAGRRPPPKAARSGLDDASRATLPVAGRRAAALRVVAFAADHQLPGDARGLVGQRHGRELGRLALEELDQPGRGMCLVPCCTCWITAVAPTTSTLRKASSPARVITPSRFLPAVE